MSRAITIINQELVYKAESALKELGKNNPLSIKLQAIISAYNVGIKQVTEVLNVARNTIRRWAKNFAAKGVKGLENAEKPPRSKLNEEQKMQLKRWLEIDPNLTLKELSLKIKKEFDIQMKKSSIHNNVRKLGFVHITGRNKHYKTCPQAKENFKKSRIIIKSTNIFYG